MVYQRLGPSLLTKRAGETILEHEGALMEVWDDTVKFLGSEVVFSLTNDRSEESSAERPPERNADQQGGARSETSPTAWTQVAGGRKRRFARRTKRRARPGGSDSSEVHTPVDPLADRGGAGPCGVGAPGDPASAGIGPPEEGLVFLPAEQEEIRHLIQDEVTVTRIHEEELPPE